MHVLKLQQAEQFFDNVNRRPFLCLGAVALLVRGLREMIEAGNAAAAIVLVGIQIAVALLNAGAMSG